MNPFLTEVHNTTAQVVEELLETAKLQRGQVLVVGCSTSEVAGNRIGTAGSEEIAEAILESLFTAARRTGIYVACQCCEHLNRALVVEEAAAGLYGWDQVSVVPVPKAGGSFAAGALRYCDSPVIVETIKANAGIDIGSTLIGMHLKAVAVPVRLSVDRIGNARLTAARTRPKLIGGERAVYSAK